VTVNRPLRIGKRIHQPSRRSLSAKKRYSSGESGVEYSNPPKLLGSSVSVFHPVTCVARYSRRSTLRISRSYKNVESRLLPEESVSCVDSVAVSWASFIPNNTVAIDRLAPLALAEHIRTHDAIRGVDVLADRFRLFDCGAADSIRHSVTPGGPNARR
jgi:hypothetical protein